MVRDDWGQRGTAMGQQSAVIRNWLGDPPYVFLTPNLNKYEKEHDADREFVEYVAADATSRRILALTDLDEFGREGDSVLDCSVVVLHPYEERGCEMLRRVIRNGRVARIFVIIWTRADLVRTMLQGLGAVDLHTGDRVPPPDSVLFEAAICMAGEQYNGLGTGNGKNAVVQLLRSFAAVGYPLDADIWLRAFFAAGGEFKEAEKVAKLITEVQRGLKHRVKPRYKPDIVEVLRARAGHKAAT